LSAAPGPVGERFLPRTAPIDAYGNGGFRFADMSHKGSILCLPSGIHAWAAKTFDDITSQSLAAIFAERGAGIEFLMIGTGSSIRRIPPELREQLRAAGISADAMDTGAACRTYNIMLTERRPVAAAFLAVD
jgi:uncharacterized protein